MATRPRSRALSRSRFRAVGRSKEESPMLDRLNALFVTAHTRLTTLDFRRDEGQTLTEYALVLGVIVLVVITALATIGDTVHAKIKGVCQAIAPTGNCP